MTSKFDFPEWRMPATEPRPAIPADAYCVAHMVNRFSAAASNL